MLKTAIERPGRVCGICLEVTMLPTVQILMNDIDYFAATIPG